MTEEPITSGLLIIGVSSTVLFDGETSTTELILLNLANGNDFALPISDEQAGVLYSHLEAGGVPEAPENIATMQQDSIAARQAEGDVRAFADQLGVGDAHVKKTAVSGETDATPQF